MSIYKDSVNSVPSSAKFAKYAESLHDSSESHGFGLGVASNPKEALQNMKMQQQMLQHQQQMMQQQMMQPMYPWQQQQMMSQQMMATPVVPQHMGAPKGFIGGSTYNPYTYT